MDVVLRGQVQWGAGVSHGAVRTVLLELPAGRGVVGAERELE